VGAPAVVMGDKVMGMCVGHLVPSPVGAPMPAPAPLPVSAPLTMGLSTTVQIGGKPAAIVGSSGYNTPPHVGLHPSDPKLVPVTQEAKVAVGSSTVLFDGQGAAYTGCTVTACIAPTAAVVGTGATVLVGS
jgi:uncharacterized Zn-binding protein involved in type VI secretion